MSPRRHPTELDQREHLALRFGLIQRRDPGPIAERVVRSAGVRRALEVPYYRLLHHGNVVPREAVAQRGRLRGSVAVQAGVSGMKASAIASHAEHIAAVLMEEHDAAGAVFAVRVLDWDPVAATGHLEIDASTAAGGSVRVRVDDGDLTALLDPLLAAVLPDGLGCAVLRDPFALSEDPTSGWRWIYPLRSPEVEQELIALHREMSFAVLRALAGTPPEELRPLKSVPSWYVPTR